MGRVLVGKSSKEKETVEVIVKEEDLSLLEGLPSFTKKSEIYPGLYVVTLVDDNVKSKLEKYAKKKRLKIVENKIPVKGEITIDE